MSSVFKIYQISNVSTQLFLAVPLDQLADWVFALPSKEKQMLPEAFGLSLEECCAADVGQAGNLFIFFSPSAINA